MNRKGLSLLLATMLALFLVPTLLSILGRAQTAHAVTFDVNIFFDEDDGLCDSSCSIRDAITEASLNGENDTIDIPAGTYTLSDTKPLTVSESLTFNGNSATGTIIDAQGNSRIFDVTAGTVTFKNLTLQGGNAAGNTANGSGGAINATGAANLIVDSTIITGNNAPLNGGGIAFTNGFLTLTNTKVLSNTAGNNGGGIFTNNGSITMDNSQVMTNTAVNSGGGIALNLGNANLIMNSGQINDNVANTTVGFPGGGIFVAQGSATINGGEIRNNLAFRGGGILVAGGTAGGSVTINNGQVIDNAANYGGGIYVYNPPAVLSINGGEITQNRSVDPTSFGGGGLYIFKGQATLNDGVISFNTALNDGGGMEIGDPEGRFTQTGGEIFNNSAGNMGGAIHNSQGILNISGGMIYANDSVAQGGGIYAAAGSNSILANSAVLTNTSTGNTGGGIHNDGSLTMTNVTLSGNNASDGAGLWNGGTAVLTNVTLSQNTAITNGGGLNNNGGTLTIGNSIIFGNSAPVGDDCNGTVTSANFNIAGPTCNFTESNDSNSDPFLQPLALNGGDTLNYALGSGSLAIDGGSNTLCPATDQRGNLRPINGMCDIGAYEDGIGFFISDASLTEGDTGNSQMTFTVTRSFITDTTYTVDYETIANTATADVDFTHVPTATLTFLPVTMTQTINIPILGDTLDEDNEQFTVQLSNQSSEVSLEDANGLGTILDDDAPPSLTIADMSVAEGDSDTVTAVLTATLSAASSKTIIVDYATMDGTAVVADSDYLSASDTITFAPGTLSQTISIDVSGDAKDEINETFTVALSNESNATLAGSSGVVTITNDDDPPTLSIANASVTEGNSGTTSMDFLVTLSAPSGKTVTVNYMTNGTSGSATAGSDYEIASGTLTFNPDDTEKTISVIINGDIVDEVNETFQIDLDNASNVAISNGQAIGTINDDDPLPTATINNATVTEGDSGTVTAVFTVTLSAASGKTITINYSSANDSATAGEDYTAVNGTLTFSPDDPLTQTISITVQGDQDTEPDEQFFLNLTGTNGNVTLGNSQGIGTISNDDGTFIFLPFVIKP